MNWSRIVPTGQCIIKKRGGAPAPCAPASMFRSSSSKPKAPPTAARNERRRKRYECISLSFGARAQGGGRRNFGHERGEAAVRRFEGVDDALNRAAARLRARAEVRVVRA